MPLLGAIAGCHCNVPRCGKGEGRPSLGGWCHCCHCCVLWLRGGKTTNFGGVVPLLGAVAAGGRGKNVERDGCRGWWLEVRLWFYICLLSLFLEFAVFSWGVFGVFSF